jgi:hypothetical protein
MLARGWDTLSPQRRRQIVGDNIHEAGHIGREHDSCEETTSAATRPETWLFTVRNTDYPSETLFVWEVRRRFPWIVLWGDHELVRVTQDPNSRSKTHSASGAPVLHSWSICQCSRSNPWARRLFTCADQSPAGDWRSAGSPRKCLLDEVMMMRIAVINQQRSAAERLPLGILRQPVAPSTRMSVST